MTNDEVKAAWRNQTPVMHEGVRYTISALIFRLPKNMTAELLDKNHNCVVIALPSDIERAESDEQ